MTDKLYRMLDLTKRYSRGSETITIFDQLDLDIYVGDFIAVTGPSGSGKTTILNLLGGLDSPDSGEILFLDKRLDQLGSGELAHFRARHIGFIFQFYNLMKSLNALENVELPLLLTGMSRQDRRRRAETALDLVGLSARAKHLPGEMSGGQQQRVAIARAIVADPEALLCDEPTGDLDRDTADEILDMLQSLNRDLGKTIIMVTHDPIAARAAKRQLRLDKGQFVEGELVV
jgi:putative ABC transport system ATP-binding protein